MWEELFYSTLMPPVFWDSTGTFLNFGIKTNQKKPHSPTPPPPPLQSNLGFAMPLEFKAFEVTLVCKTLVTSV